PASELRVDADSDVAGIERMIVVEQVLVPERASHRKLPAFGEAPEILAGLAGPPGPTQDGDRPVRALQQRSQPPDLLWRWRRGRAPGARRRRRLRLLREHVLGKGEDHGSRASGDCSVE